MESPKNLKFLVIWDPSPDISVAIEKDKETLKSYCQSLEKEGYDIDYDEICSTEIASYTAITKRCDSKTRVLIWYTGHGKNLNSYVQTQKDNFPCFSGNKIFIEQYKLLEKLPRNILNVIIFDCCNNANHKPDDDVQVAVNNNFSTLFDFEGEMLINSAKRNQSSFCRSVEGSTFTINFLKLFNSTYDNTLRLLTNYVSSSMISFGRLKYEKYVKEDEISLKSDIINQRKFESDLLFRLVDDIDVKQHNSKLSRRNNDINKDMDTTIEDPSDAGPIWP